jgi:hypothetical protein
MNVVSSRADQVSQIVIQGVFKNRGCCEMIGGRTAIAGPALLMLAVSGGGCLAAEKGRHADSPMIRRQRDSMGVETRWIAALMSIGKPARRTMKATRFPDVIRIAAFS